MNYHSKIVRKIARNVCNTHHCSGLFDDLCQIGEMSAYRLDNKPFPYIITSIRRTMTKSIPKRQPESLRDSLYVESSPDLELSIDFIIRDHIKSELDQQIFIDHYIHNFSIKELSDKYNISVSSLYRTIARLKRNFINDL